MSSEYSTEAKVQQHHLTSKTAAMDASTYQRLVDGAATVQDAVNKMRQAAPRAAAIVEREIKSFLQATIPEHRVRCISQITGILRESEFFDKRNTAECALFLQKFAVNFVFPLLLHSSVRYLHRALATLLRTVYVMSEELEAVFCNCFVSTHLQPWIQGTNRPTLLSRHDPSNPLQLKDVIMNWVNCIDGTACVAIPIFPAVFARTFCDVVPLLGDSLCWMVDNACRRSSHAASVPTCGDVLLGEDLSYVRYGIRVVTTYIHKFLYLLEEQVCNGDDGELAVVKQDLCRLLSPSLSMLSLNVFPKDVLNGAGLLVSSLLTLRTCDGSLLLDVCRCCVTSDSPEGEGSVPHIRRGDNDAMRQMEGRVRDLVDLLCSDNPQRDVLQRPSLREALHETFSSFTSNGHFAFMKGLLSHLSTPLHNSISSLGVLLRPTMPLVGGCSSSSSASSRGAMVTVYDVIIPTAKSYCSALHVPDTRFMAIQTIDSVIHHLSSVFTCIADLLEAPGKVTTPKGVKALRKGLRSTHKPRTLTEAERQELSVLFTNTTALNRALSEATEVIMGMWDDSTQHVAGPLYGAYSEVLAVHAALKRCRALIPENSGAQLGMQNELDMVETLHAILLLPNERRGKYHALLALLDVVEVPQLIVELRRYYTQQKIRHHSDRNASGTKEEVSEVEALREFVRMLLSGAVNPKVGSAAGEVFAKAANRVRLSCDAVAGTDSLFVEGVIEPLIESMLFSGYAAPQHFDDAARISNIVTHMISPCLKYHDSYLPILITRLLSMVASERYHCRVNQCVVEIIRRAQVAGRDVSKYIQPGSDCFRAILTSLQSVVSEHRFTALGLCVLSMRKAEPVQHWQCRLMEWYISANMHSGGDSAAMRSLLEMYKKWTRRLIDSCASYNNKLRRKADDCETNENYMCIVTEHCARTVHYIEPHIGTSAEWCYNLSLERRVTAMLIYSRLLVSTVEFLSESRMTELSESLFPESLVEGLLLCLSSGWVKARSCAFNILELYATYAPTVLFSERYLGGPEVAIKSKKESANALTYKKAEGEVLKYLLATCLTPVAKEAAVKHPAEECRRRLGVFEVELAVVNGQFEELQKLDAEGVCNFIKNNPFHGSLSLCSALLSDACAVDCGAEVLCKACHIFLRCCSSALQVCSLLVGGESLASSNGSEVNVDCRGHAFDKGKPHGETEMRTVVNNAWLCIRTASAAVERVVRLVKIERLSLEYISGACYALVETLLRTKHNGVMRAVREALKAVCAVLLRSREAKYHMLPQEILDFLLGPDGVTSPSVARMLRRSQGLPHALLSVLEAEDPGAPAALFPRAIKALLKVATVSKKVDGAIGLVISRDDDQRTSEPVDEEVCRSQRSNSLNVLKFIFENKAFASRSVGYLEDAFWIAASGFDDPSWGIRNSSLMLFSAVLPRFVGEHPSTGGVGVNTSLHDIAMRAPRAVAFAYEELVKSSTNPLPSLGVFPLLQMLSMLVPDPPHLITKTTVTLAKEKGKDEPNSLHIIDAILCCGSSRNLMIRSACSVALTSLVSPPRIEEIFLRFRSLFADPSTKTNTLHGALLHIQQFHTYYVGTLRRHLRSRALNSSLTPSVKQLVSRLTLESVSSNCGNLNMLRVCLHCPAVAATFLSVGSDVLFSFTSSFINEKEEIGSSVGDSLLSLVGIGLSMICNIFCTPTTLYTFSRGYHTAAEKSAALFALLSVQYLQVVGSAADQSLWKCLRDVFASAGGEALISCVMDHMSFLLVNHRWTRETAMATLQHCADKVGCDLFHFALKTLRQNLTELPSSSCFSCVELSHLCTQLEFAVVVGNEQLVNIRLYSEHFSAVEATLLQQMDPSSGCQLRRADVQSWAIRFLALGCSLHRRPSEDFLRILSLYSLPAFDMQTRAAVVDALQKGIETSPSPRLTTVTVAADFPEYLCVYLLLLLQLLFDDAYDVRLAACRVISGFVLPSYAMLDHTSCVVALVSLLRSRFSSGNLSALMVSRYVLGSADSHLLETPRKDTCYGEDGTAGSLLDESCAHGNTDGSLQDEVSDDDGEILFEKEADNLFAEASLLTYLVDLITKKNTEGGPQFTAYKEMVQMVEQCGNPALVYTTLIDERF